MADKSIFLVLKSIHIDIHIDILFVKKYLFNVR